VTLQVQFAFDAGAGGETNFFTLGDPVRGVIGSTAYTLGGSQSLTDVTQYVRSVSVSRGRSRQLERVQTGNATVVLDNRARLFDPNHASSPYASSIKPRRNVVITSDGEPLFTGLVEDWDLEFQLSGDATSAAACADGFLVLSQAAVTAGTQSPEASGVRVDAVLTEIDWPTSKRDLDTGQVTLQADVVDANVNLLDYLQLVADTEYGALFMARDGRVTFRDRDYQQSFVETVEFGGTAIPYSAITVGYGSDLLYNLITLTREAGGTAIAAGTASQADYGIAELSKSGYLHATDAETQELADYLLSVYAEPTFRITGMSIHMDGLTSAQRTSVCGLEIADAVQVTFSPAVGSAIVQYARVDRIAHTISPDRHEVSLEFSQATPSFILGHPEFGLIGGDYGLGL
jgi:hypothetical protein